MDAVEVVTDASMTSARSGNDAGVSSAGSYTDHVLVQSDSGSGAHAPQSPPRSAPSSSANSPSSVNRQPNSNLESTAPRTPEPRPQFRVRGHNGVMLGVHHLEQQQAAMEHRRQYTPDPHQGYSTSRQQGFVSSDDDHTEPSSSATGNTGDNPAGYTRSDGAATSTFGRLIQSTRRRIHTGDRKRSDSLDDDEEDVQEGALIYGYLQKLGRNGKWATRWFETDGECLTYYKSSKRTKALATLDLAKVGSIVINHDDPKGTWFTINISSRPYHLRTDSKAACKDWVITLNRVKEARMQEGNVKILMPGRNPNQPPDFLDQNFTPRVVVVANRQRTRAVDDDEINSWETVGWDENPANANSYIAPSSSGRLARWQKPRTSLNRMASKILLWARSIRNFGCTDVENQVVLDHHVHPPGHDDKRERSANASPAGRDTVGADPSSGERAPIAITMDSDSINESINQSDEGETRELS